MTAPGLKRITEKTESYETAPFDPASSVFVSANAGAGKTQWLTGRVLSLLLAGIAPSRILCLTFTNAAAAEMSQRILAELGAWVMADGQALGKKLEALLKRVPDDEMLARARGLFAAVLEAPEGVRIETIHGFCQSLLRRFPIEAGISPHFTVMDSRSEQELLWEARLRLFDRAGESAPLQEAVRVLAQYSSATGLQKLFEHMARHKEDFASLLYRPNGIEAAVEELWQCLNMPPDMDMPRLVERHFSYDNITLVSLRRIAALLCEREKSTDRDTGQGIAGWLACAERNETAVESYVQVFLTVKYTKRDKLFTKDGLTDAASIEQLLKEQERVAAFHEARQSLLIARLSATVLRVAQAFLSLYGELKGGRAEMDYGDLISTVRSLLTRPGISPWVLYKLDGGIDHVLIDEAQDTSPAQWEIIGALTDDFFAGHSRSEGARSLSIVGDEKQSIFSFQGADPKRLAAMHGYFRARIEAARHPALELSLNRSFRSVPQVLQAVDAVFALPAARAGVLAEDETLNHIAHRASENGLVEMWPLIIAGEESAISPPLQLARLIAETIHGWLDKGLWLEAKNRALEPGDIMILLRTRTHFADALVRALKRKNVPVAGVDRMKLSDNLAVQDLIALGQFLLLPEDDLNLAALLKSPLCNLDEDTLFALAQGRGDKSVWERLAENAACADVYALLHGLRGKADYLPPYGLYAHALDTLGLRRKILGRMGSEYADPIDEFLSQAMAYQQENVASLQGFLHWLTHSESEIKRDMEQSRNAVRVLSVHGAKGLQAPVVILPDTAGVPALKDALLWHEGLPLWPPSADEGNALCRRLREEMKRDALDEHRRLLYVAMTRAEDHLYICGAAAKEKLSEHAWYHLMRRGFEPLAESCETPAGQGWRLGKEILRRKTSPALPPKAEKITVENFLFLTNPLPPEKSPPSPLTPSQQAAEPPAASPTEKNVYARGLLIHTLLEHLPDLPKEARPAAAGRLSAAHRAMPQAERDQCIKEALTLMENPLFADIFSPQALAEAPVAGKVRLQDKEFAVSGQIDRLLVGDKEIWIVDYKTNRRPPVDKKDTPPAYRRQLALYRLLLREIYPGKAIRCALLWTAVPRMDVLDEALLETYI